MNENYLSTMEIDAIGEILNISLGASATAVSTMLDTRVDITTPVVRVEKKEDFAFSNLKPAIGVEITYIEGLSGRNIMLLKRRDVKVIVEMLMGTTFSDEEFELNEMNISAICEVMNQMMGASSTALSELFGRTVNISTPKSFEVEGEEQFKEKYFTEDAPMVVIGFNLKIGEKMESEFLNLMSIELAKELVSGFFTDGLPEDSVKADEKARQPREPVQPKQEKRQPEQPDAASTEKKEQDRYETSVRSGQEDIQAVVSEKVQVPVTENTQAPVLGGQMAEQMLQTMQMMQQQMLQMQQAQAERKISVKKAAIPPLKGEGYVEEPDANLDLLMNVPLELSVEIGRTKKQVKEILELNKGSLVVLDRIAGEPVDLYVNGECIAKGDVVVVDDNFGIRITEILQDEIIAGK